LDFELELELEDDTYFAFLLLDDVDTSYRIFSNNSMGPSRAEYRLNPTAWAAADAPIAIPFLPLRRRIHFSLSWTGETSTSIVRKGNDFYFLGSTELPIAQKIRTIPENAHNQQRFLRSSIYHNIGSHKL
jgi:hypothetical protein